MATVITSECINCGACEPECPNTAIYQGGVEWDFNGAKHAALSNDIFFIVPEKCTECVGFFDQEACAVVCPVDCCVPDPARPETEAALLQRAGELHPDKSFGADAPSRFKKEGGGATAAAPAAAPVAAGPVGAQPAAAPASASSPAVAPAPAAAKAAPAPVAGGRVEKPLSPPRAKPQIQVTPMREKTQAGELPGSFEAVLAQLGNKRRSRSGFFKWIMLMAQPLLGALPFSQKQALETYVGDPRFFSAAGATGFNALHNVIIYPIVLLALTAASGASLFSKNTGSIIFYGIAIAILESMWRMREGFIGGAAADQIAYRGTWYGLLLSPAFVGVTRRISRGSQQGSVAFDGFQTGTTFERKSERERRYGEMYTVEDKGGGYLFRLEFPSEVPRSALKEDMGIPDQMPGYDYTVKAQGTTLTITGHIVDEAVRKLAAVSTAFPPDFTTVVELPEAVAGFKHRIRDRILEVVLVKR